MWLWHPNDPSRMKYAVLIGTKENPATSDDIVELVSKIKSHKFLQYKYLHRIYYYDAPPYSKSKNKLLNGGKHNFGSDPLTPHNNRLLKELHSQDHFALRMGEIRFRGWELDRNSFTTNDNSCHITADNLRPSLQQKGVDMRIGLDIASLTLKEHADVIVLVTGDADFVPPMKFARREGVQPALVSLGHNIHSDLKEHADLILDLPT